MTKKVRASVALSEETYGKCRDIVAALGGAPHLLTISQLVEDALQKRFVDLEKAYNQGKPFPKFEGRIKVGRPIGT